MCAVRFMVYNTSGAKPMAAWWLCAANNRMIGWSGATFVSLSDAKRAAEAFKDEARALRYDVYQDASGSWRWRAGQSEDVVASSGEAFANRSTAQAAADQVRDHAGFAIGP